MRAIVEWCGCNRPMADGLRDDRGTYDRGGSAVPGRAGRELAGRADHPRPTRSGHSPPPPALRDAPAPELSTAHAAAAQPAGRGDVERGRGAAAQVVARDPPAKCAPVLRAG